MDTDTKGFYKWLLFSIYLWFTNPKSWHFISTISGFAGTLFLAYSVIHAQGLYSSNGPLAGINDEYFQKGINLITLSYTIEIFLFLWKPLQLKRLGASLVRFIIRRHFDFIRNLHKDYLFISKSLGRLINL